MEASTHKEMVNGIEYWKDQRGSLIPADKVSEIDQLRDDVVREMVSFVKPLGSMMSDAKRKVYSTMDTFLAMSSEAYGVKRKGTKGNVTLLTYNGKYKVALAYNDRAGL